MEKELASKIFMLEDYNSKENMEKDVKEYMEMLKNSYPKAIITKEFYKGQNILIRATIVENQIMNKQQKNKEREIDDWYIRQRGER